MDDVNIPISFLVDAGNFDQDSDINNKIHLFEFKNLWRLSLHMCITELSCLLRSHAPVPWYALYSNV